MQDSTSPDVVTRYENETWSRCAESYADTFHMLTSQALPLLVKAATIPSDSRVLDLGSGPGDASAMLVGIGASVTGVDFSRQMVEVARRRHPRMMPKRSRSTERASMRSWPKDRDRLADNLLAAKLLSRGHAVEARQMEALLRLMALIDRLAANDADLKEPGAVRLALERPTLIGQLIAAPGRDVPKEEPPKKPRGPDPEVGKLHDRVKGLEGLAANLTRVAPRSFALPQAPPARPRPVTPDALETLRGNLVANILKGEFKKREHLRKRETETTVTVEVETKKEEERDTRTTERFELQREASQAVKEDSSFKAGQSVSGSYGPTVEFKASTDFAMNHSKEEAAKGAPPPTPEEVRQRVRE
jgi:SAM-dependent methyltransferase